MVEVVVSVRPNGYASHRGLTLTRSIKESCNKGLALPPCLANNRLCSCLAVVAALTAVWQQSSMASGVILGPSPLFVGRLNGSGHVGIHTPASLPVRLQVTVCNEMGEEDSTKDAFTQNIYYRMIKRWATWWWCVMEAGYISQLYVAWERRGFFQTNALAFTLCSCDSNYIITKSTSSSLFIFKQIDFTFHL